MHRHNGRYAQSYRAQVNKAIDLGRFLPNRNAERLHTMAVGPGVCSFCRFGISDQAERGVARFRQHNRRLSAALEEMDRPLRIEIVDSDL